MDYISLTSFDLVLASLVLLLNGGISIAFRLGLEKSIAVSTLRMAVQLTLIGLILKFIFEATTPLWTIAFACVMFAAGGYEVWSRQDTRIHGWQALAMGATVPFASGLIITFFALTLILSPDPWYAPRYFLPILGMMIGNALAGVSLVMNTITSSVQKERDVIEARLALGDNRFEAMQDILKHSMKTGMMPILTAMAASGLVTLPGMMSGQILAGIDPMDAAKYQIMIMCLVAGATALSVVAGGLGVVYLIFDSRHRLRLDWLKSSQTN